MRGNPIPRRICLPWLLWLPLSGCDGGKASPQAMPQDPTWSDRQEVIHQLRELIRYEDETERERREALRSLDLPVDSAAGTEAGVAAGIGENQRHHQ